MGARTSVFGAIHGRASQLKKYQMINTIVLPPMLVCLVSYVCGIAAWAVNKRSVNCLAKPWLIL